MNQQPIARSVAHPIMFQGWRSLTFLHWPYPPQALERLLSAELHLDMFDNQAWLGLTPFLLRGLRVPALPFRSDFPETNLRTYVRDRDGNRGIWFFSLDAGSLAAVLGARTGFGLPYFWSTMEVARRTATVEYRSVRKTRGGDARLRAVVEPGPAAQPSDLTGFLTERYRLYTRLFGRLAAVEVEHRPWPLQRARLIEFEQTLIGAAGLPDARGEPLVHYSDGVEARIGRPRSCR